MNEHYELTYIVPIKYLEDELNKVNESVVGFVKKANGEITKEDNLGKQKLAYPIEHISQGTYMVLEFDMPQVNVKQVDTELKLMPEVLRHLIIKKRVKTEQEIKREADIQERLRKEKEDQLEAMEAEDKKEIKKTEVKAEVKVEEPKPEEKPAEESAEEPVEEKVEDPTEVKAEEETAEIKVDEPKEEKKADDDKATLEDLDKKLDEILTDDIL